MIWQSRGCMHGGAAEQGEVSDAIEPGVWDSLVGVWGALLRSSRARGVWVGKSQERRMRELILCDHLSRHKLGKHYVFAIFSSTRIKRLRFMLCHTLLSCIY